MEQLTLKQEIDRIPEIPDHYIEGEPNAYIDGWKAGMKEGADWQKEQFKRLITLAKEAAIIAGTEGFNSLRRNTKHLPTT